MSEPDEDRILRDNCNAAAGAVDRFGGKPDGKLLLAAAVMSTAAEQLSTLLEKKLRTGRDQIFVDERYSQFLFYDQLMDSIDKCAPNDMYRWTVRLEFPHLLLRTVAMDYDTSAEQGPGKFPAFDLAILPNNYNPEQHRDDPLCTAVMEMKLLRPNSNTVKYIILDLLRLALATAPKAVQRVHGGATQSAYFLLIEEQTGILAQTRLAELLPTEYVGKDHIVRLDDVLANATFVSAVKEFQEACNKRVVPEDMSEPVKQYIQQQPPKKFIATLRFKTVVQGANTLPQYTAAAASAATSSADANATEPASADSTSAVAVHAAPAPAAADSISAAAETATSPATDVPARFAVWLWQIHGFGIADDAEEFEPEAIAEAAADAAHASAAAAPSSARSDSPTSDESDAGRDLSSRELFLLRRISDCICDCVPSSDMDIAAAHVLVTRSEIGLAEFDNTLRYFAVNCRSFLSIEELLQAMRRDSGDASGKKEMKKRGRGRCETGGMEDEDAEEEEEERWKKRAK